MNKYKEEYREVEEAYKLILDYVCCDDATKEKKRAMLFLKDTFLEINAKAEALEKALDLIKQKRENAKLQLKRNYKYLDELNNKVCSTAVERVECEEEKRRINEIYNIRLREELATYTDCIITIKTEMGRERE